MRLKPMDPNLVRRLVDSHVDVITPAAKADAELYRAARCPLCGSIGADKVLLPPKIVADETGAPTVMRSTFSASSPIPQGYARCTGCKATYDPRTGFIVRHGDLTGVQP